MEIVKLIETVGFPIVAVLGMAYFFKEMIVKFFDNVMTGMKEDKEALKEELKFNRNVANELLNTNKLLAQDLTKSVVEVKNDIEDINHKLDDVLKKDSIRKRY